MSALLTDNLPLLAGAPNGIQKLRELILELAVRGKLVPQDPSDEPASELLKRIAEEKARLVAEGRIKKQKPLAEIGDEEKPFELPEGWEWSRLSEVALINPRNSAADSVEVSFVPMTLIGTRFDGQHGQEVRTWAEVKQGFTHFAEGDVGVAKITPCFENSKACVFSELKNGLGAGTTELHIVRPVGDFLAARYVLAYLKSPQFLLVGETKMTGTAGQKRLPKDFVESNPFPLPPLAEQHRIVAKVDELTALCDRLEARQADAESAHARLVQALLDSLTQARDAADFAASWQRLSAHFHSLFVTESSIGALKQSLLQLAVMGKLVPQNAEDEPAGVFLQRKGIASTGHFLDGWAEVPLGSLGEILGGSTPSKAKAEFWVGDIPWVSPKDMKRPVINDAQDHVSEKALAETSLKAIPVNSLLMVVRGMILAHSFPVALTSCVVTINQDMKALVAPEEISSYLLIYLQAVKQVMVGLVDRSTHGTCKLVSEKLWSHKVGLPPLAEQHRIITKLDELFALCDQLKSRLNSARQLHARLAATLAENAVA